MITGAFISLITGTLNFSQLGNLYPLFLLGLVAFAILAIGIKVENAKLFSYISFTALAIVFVWLYFLPVSSSTTLSGTTIYNRFGTYFAMIMILASLLVIFPAARRLTRKPDIFYATLLFVNIGIIIASYSYNILVMFVSFEAVSIGTYIMAAFGKERRNLEASLKYFFTSTIATAFIAFGASFYYITTGTFNIATVGAVKPVQSADIALIFLAIGFGFKMAIFPMHQWAIDTYDGAENSVAAYLSTGSKILAFVIILKVFLVGFAGDFNAVFYLFTILAIASMTYGNIAALSQNNVKRVLAYSSVAQVGYLILVLSQVAFVNNLSSHAATLAIATGMYYSLVYIFMKGGAFLTMNAVKKDKVEITDMAGLYKKSPSVAVSFSIILLALAGIPVTGGFFAKYNLFLALIAGQLWWLAVIAILNSAISVFYYFRIIQSMFREPEGESDFNLSSGIKAPVIATAFITVGLGVAFQLIYALMGFAPGLFG